MDAVALLPRCCKVCGAPVTADTSRARTGMTARHTLPEDVGFDQVCRGSKIRFTSQPTTNARPAKRIVKTELPASPFRRTLAKLRGSSVTHVDFLEARVQRALGHVTEREHCRRFIRAEVRIVALFFALSLASSARADQTYRCNVTWMTAKGEERTAITYEPASSSTAAEAQIISRWMSNGNKSVAADCAEMRP